jgi:hypothetical protein
LDEDSPNPVTLTTNLISQDLLDNPSPTTKPDPKNCNLPQKRAKSPKYCFSEEKTFYAAV